MVIKTGQNAEQPQVSCCTYSIYRSDNSFCFNRKCIYIYIYIYIVECLSALAHLFFLLSIFLHLLFAWVYLFFSDSTSLKSSICNLAHSIKLSLSFLFLFFYCFFFFYLPFLLHVRTGNWSPSIPRLPNIHITCSRRLIAVHFILM